MKFGVRKPSLKKSIKARTTGKLKRVAKKAIIPGYGKKGMGFIRNPKKSVYNKVYNKTSFSAFGLLKNGNKKPAGSEALDVTSSKSTTKNAVLGVVLILAGIILFLTSTVDFLKEFDIFDALWQTLVSIVLLVVGLSIVKATKGD